MHVQNHPSVRHEGVYFTQFLTDADMDAHRALRPVLAELRDCGYPDAKLRNGKILAKDRNGAVRFLGAAGAQAWIRAASAATGPGPRAPGSSEGSLGGGATGAGAAGPASAGPPPAAAPLSRPVAPHAPPPPPPVQPPQAAAGAGQPAVRAPQRKSRKQKRGGGSGGSIGAPGQAVRAAQATEAARAASIIAEIQGTCETRAAASQLRQTSRANASATAIHEQAAQHAPAQAMQQPTPTTPVAANQAPAPPSLPEAPAGAAEAAPTRAIVAAAASAAAVPSIGDKRSVGVAFTPPRERRSFLERAVQLVETVFSPGAEPPAQRPALLGGGSEQLPDRPRVSAQRALFTAQVAAAGVAPVAQPQLALAAPAAAQAVLSQTGGSVGTDSMPSCSVPAAWKSSTVTPLYKKGDPMDVANYRPVAIGVPLARLYARILNARLSPYLESQHLRAEIQGFRANRSVGHNLFALQHVIDKHASPHGRPLYCCFVDLTAACDTVPRHLLWQRLRSLGVCGRMLAALQAFYSEPTVAVKVAGRVGEPAVTKTGVHQGCPLSSTLFGVFIDALEPWLRAQAPDVGIPIQTARGMTRHLSALIYADDIALLADSPTALQQLLDNLCSFCKHTGMDISLSKTKVMQFLPRPRSRSRSAPSQHHFNRNTVTLENVDSYKYLGVTFKSTGNPVHYMPAARHKITASYHAMRQNYCGLACGTNARLSFFAAAVTSTACYGGEIWGVHPRARTEQKKTARLYNKYLCQLLKLSPGTCTTSLMLELGDMPLPDRWLQCCIRFWNRILSLPVDDLYRDVLSDSVLNNVGLARGLQERMCDIGLPLSLQQPHLQRINEGSVAAQLRHRQQDSLEASLGVDPRTWRSEGAAICTYWRWFRRADGQQRHRLRAGVFGHASTSKRAHELLRFRLGCHTLLSVTGRRAGIPRSERLCLLCMHG